MLLADLMALEELPEEVSGALTGPTGRVRVLHARPCTGAPADIPERYHLAGCVLCGNTAAVAHLDRRLRSSETRLAELGREVVKALGEGDGQFGRDYALAALRIGSDPAWRPEAVEDEDDWFVGDKEFRHLNRIVEGLAAQYQARIFTGEHFGTTRPDKDLVLVSANLLPQNAPELVLSQVPLRICVVGRDLKVLVSARRSLHKDLVERNYRRTSNPVLSTGRTAAVLAAPGYDDTWRLAMEILESQLEERERSRDGRVVDLDAVLSAAEAALA